MNKKVYEEPELLLVGTQPLGLLEVLSLGGVIDDFEDGGEDGWGSEWSAYQP